MTDIIWVCDCCLSDNITFDCTAVWNCEKQDYEIINLDAAWCHNCKNKNPVRTLKVLYRFAVQLQDGSSFITDSYYESEEVLKERLDQVIHCKKLPFLSISVPHYESIRS